MREYSILEIQSAFQNDEMNSCELTARYLKRIQLIDREGPALNSVIELNPDAIDIARSLDAERSAGKIRGLLHGVPILIKDNIETSDRMSTTSGSLALAGYIAKHDAFLVSRLREAGAVIMGKTNLSEWANFRSNHSISGWSSRGGQTRNPYALDRSPCGSSSGSAVAVAANLCAAAIGTETDGSIVCPAQTNGIVGIKPTLGLVSRAGIIPIAHSQDTAGPMTRSVSDAAIMLEVIQGIDQYDPATFALADRAPGNYLQACRSMDLKNIRIGVARAYFGFDPRVDKVIENCISVMKELGAEIIDPVELIDENKLAKTEMEVLLYEFHSDLDHYLAGLESSSALKTVLDVINFNENNAAAVMPFFGQERMIAAQKKGPLTQKKYLHALERNFRLSRQDGIDKILSVHNLDAIAAPTGGPAWLIDSVNGDRYSGGGFSSLAAVAGYPHITVPAGQIFELPVGISLFASAWSEYKLFLIAHAFELAARIRKAPKFLPTVELLNGAVNDRSIERITESKKM